MSDWSSETDVQDRTGQPANSRCEIRSERLLQSEVLDPCQTEAVRPRCKNRADQPANSRCEIRSELQARPPEVREPCRVPPPVRGARFVWDWSSETVVQIPIRSTREITVRDPF